MIGIVKNSLPDGESLDALSSLRRASDLGLNGVLFNSLFDISADLDVQEMRHVRQAADRLGLDISAGLGALNPALPFRGKAVAAAGGGELESGVQRMIEAASEIGIHDLFFLIGMIEERFRTDVPWTSQMEAVATMLSRLEPVSRACGSRLLIKTHEEITTTEIAALIGNVGSDFVGVALDPVNVVCRLEDPVAATARIAAHVRQVHVDDAIVRFENNGIRRYLAPLGDGAIDWPAINSLVGRAPAWIEMHRGQFFMPIFDAGWLAAQTDVALPEFASVLSMAADFGDRDVPWSQDRPHDRIPAALGTLMK